MGEVIQLASYRTKSVITRTFARHNDIPVVELHMSDIRPTDMVGYPVLKTKPLTQADKDLINECETIFLDHFKMTGKDLRQPDGSEWMLDERDI